MSAPAVDPAVDLGTWRPVELLAAGFDRLGAVQPLLRPQPEAYDALAVRHDLVRRGLLERHGGRLQPVGDLRVVLSTRATARLTVVVTGLVASPLLLLGRFAEGDGLLQVLETGGTCAVSLRTRAAVAEQLAATVLDGLPDAVDGPVLRPADPAWQPSLHALAGADRTVVLDAVLVDGTGVRTALRLALLAVDGRAWLVTGSREDEPGALTARSASRETAVAAVAQVLVGRPPD